MKLHLEPFAYAINITQSDKARLDTVLLVLALLYSRFEHLPRVTPSDTVVADTICNSINSRWEASDQDVFIAAVILNPTHKTRPFKHSRWFSIGFITILMARLYRRFFSEEVPREVVDEVPQYLNNEGAVYSELQAFMAICVLPVAGSVSLISFWINNISFLILQ